MPKRRPLVQWGETPAPRSTKHNWAEIAAEVKAHASIEPMKWGIVFDTCAISVANAARQGHVKAVHPDLGFEYMTTNGKQGVTDGKRWRTCTLWMRFNPDNVVPLRETLSHRKDK